MKPVKKVRVSDCGCHLFVQAAGGAAGSEADSSGAEILDAGRNGSGRDNAFLLNGASAAENGSSLEEGRALAAARAGRREPRPSWLGRIFESAVFFWACVVFAPGMQARRCNSTILKQPVNCYCGPRFPLRFPTAPSYLCKKKECGLHITLSVVEGIWQRDGPPLHGRHMMPVVT
jgi:hypothetical protein